MVLHAYPCLLLNIDGGGNLPIIDRRFKAWFLYRPLRYTSVEIAQDYLGLYTPSEGPKHRITGRSLLAIKLQEQNAHYYWQLYIFELLRSF